MLEADWLISVLINNKWMRLSILWKIMEIEEGVIRRGVGEADNTLRDLQKFLIHMIRKPNSIIVLLFIQNNP